MVCLFMLFGSLLTSSTYLNPLITKQELCTLETKLPSSESIPLFLQFSDDELKHIKYVSNDNNETQTRLMKQSMRFKYYYLAINNSDISCKEELLALVNDYYYRKFLP